MRSSAASPTRCRSTRRAGTSRWSVFKPPAGRLAAPLGLNQTNIKKYPVRDSCQLPIDTALELRKKLAGRQPKSLKVDTYKSAHLGAVADPELWAPKTRETADHSMPF